MLAMGESKAYTREIFLKDLADKVGAGKCIESITMWGLNCSSYGFPHLWSALSNNIVDTGLKTLVLLGMGEGVTSGDVMPLLLDSSSMKSLTCLNLSRNATWWESTESFPQLLIVVKRQTQLEEF